MKCTNNNNKLRINLFKGFIKEHPLQSSEREKGIEGEKTYVLLCCYCSQLFLSLILWWNRGFSIMEPWYSWMANILCCLSFFFILVFRHHIFILKQRVVYPSYQYLNSLGGVLTLNPLILSTSAECIYFLF